ncbi:MFS domain-containing protein [Lachancea thermotolerans]
MYGNLESEKCSVGWGSSLMRFYSIDLATIPFVYKKYGPHMRRRSSYAN